MKLNHAVELFQHARESISQSDLEVEWSLIMKWNHEVESFQHGDWLKSVDRENLIWISEHEIYRRPDPILRPTILIVVINTGIMPPVWINSSQASNMVWTLLIAHFY